MGKKPFTEERRIELQQKTKGVAAAVIEDLEHIREVISRPNPIKGELRRLSAVLRRLLTDDEINLAAACRIGRVKVLQPDTREQQRDAKENPYAFFCTGGATVFGIMMRNVSVHSGPPRGMPRTSPEARTEVDIGTFVKEPVLCVRGEWVSRGAVITYVANVASGVHSKSPKTKADEIIGYARGAMSFKIGEGGVPHFIANPDRIFVPDDRPLAYDPQDIDPVLVEILSAATVLAESPNVSDLEKCIRQELGLVKL